MLTIKLTSLTTCCTWIRNVPKLLATASKFRNSRSHRLGEQFLQPKTPKKTQNSWLVGYSKLKRIYNTPTKGQHYTKGSLSGQQSRHTRPSLH